ncbi:GNAT family N-acetyltransferase [Actinophytocola sediminis]
MTDPILAAFHTQLRDVVRPSLDGGMFERVGPVIRCTSKEPDGWNGVEWSALDASTADGVIAEQLAYFAERGRRIEWKYYSYDQPADLPDRLRAAGLAAGPVEALMIAEVADTPLDTPPPAGIEFRIATSDEDLALVKQVHDEVFGGDHTLLVEELRARSRSTPEALAAVLAVADDGQPVCAARVDFHVGTAFASLWGGGTLPAWRHRGVYRAMVSYRARLAAERGYRYLRTDALPTSRPILERLGFRQICTTTPFTPAA